MHHAIPLPECRTVPGGVRLGVDTLPTLVPVTTPGMLPTSKVVWAKGYGHRPLAVSPALPGIHAPKPAPSPGPVVIAPPLKLMAKWAKLGTVDTVRPAVAVECTSTLLDGATGPMPAILSGVPSAGIPAGTSIELLGEITIGGTPSAGALALIQSITITPGSLTADSLELLALWVEA